MKIWTLFDIYLLILKVLIVILANILEVYKLIFRID